MINTDDTTKLRIRPEQLATPSSESKYSEAISFAFITTDCGVSAALVKFVHEIAPPIRLGHPSMRALAGLADHAAIPFLLVRYADNFAWYYVTPGNAKATEYLAEPKCLTEPQWIELLYRVRGREVPKELSGQLV